MNPTDRFDHQITEHLRTEAPRETPAHLLDETMSRIADTPQRGGGWLGRPAVRLLAAAAVLVLAVVAGAQFAGLIDPPVGSSASPSPSASASPSPSASATTSPSEKPTAEPSSTPTARGPDETVLDFIQRCDVPPPVVGPSVSILADGRVVWNRLNQDQSSTLSVRRLNPEGLAQVRDAVTGTGLFDADGVYRLVRRAGTGDPPAHGYCVWDFVWEGGPAPVRVSSTMWFGDEEESAYYEPSPERLALHQLAIDVQDPEAWIDPSGWEDAAAMPFVPLSYLVLAGVTSPQVATEGAPDVDAVTWPFAQAADAFGEPVGDGQQRCGIADAAAIEQLAAELAAAGLEQFEGVPNMAMVALPWGSRDAAIDLFIYPQMPDGEPPCGGSVVVSQ
ncbi:MAG: hypothetical protein QOI85_1859 [Chloroflexota bacterium]|nr:hypothetical protein [Chloroflexota bacterium]